MELLIGHPISLSNLRYQSKISESILHISLPQQQQKAPSSSMKRREREKYNGRRDIK